MITQEQYGDVHRIDMTPTLFGKRIFPTNAYVIESLLIDTGPANLSDDFLVILKDFSISTVVNTHTHPDHIGSNHAFSFVYVHPNGFEQLKHPKLDMMIQKLLYGLPQPSVPKEIPSRIETDHYTFDVLYTPGHSPDHISLYEPEQKWAFTGDLLLWGSTREVYIDVQIYDAIESLQRLSTLDIDRLFPGHGPPFKNPGQALTNQVKTLTTFETEIKELHMRGWSAEEIRNHIFGRERMYVYLCGGKFSAINLVKSYLGESDGQ
jgi:glyoxylase-like metal-dependent hydrolase (beta-lactamase superfamily II)